MTNPIEAFNPTAETSATPAAKPASEPSEQSNRTQLLKSVLSELQLAANRLNAQKSTGPAKPETKDRVKYNARRHGFTGQVLLLTLEEQPLYDSFVSGTLEDLAPKGTQETFLAHSIAEESWRLNCSNLTAAGTFEGAGKQFHAGEGWNHQIEDAVVDTVVARDRSKELALMSLYMQRTQRAREKYRKELQELQAERKARREAELEEARLLYQFAEMQGVPYDPKADGIVFSLAEIKAYSERHRRRNLAKMSERPHREDNNPVEIPRASRKAA